MQGKKMIEASGFGPLEGQNDGTPWSPYGPGDHGPQRTPTHRHSTL